MTKQDQISKLLELFNVDNLLEAEKQMQEDIKEGFYTEDLEDDTLMTAVANNQDVLEFMNQEGSLEALTSCLTSRLEGVHANSIKAFIAQLQHQKAITDALTLGMEDFYKMSLPSTEDTLKH